MVGNGNHHRVNIRPREHVAEILVAGAAPVFGIALDAVELIHQAAVMIPPGGVHIAHRHDLGIGHGQEVVQEGAPLGAGANDAQRDAVIGAFPGGGGPQQQRRAQRGSCGGLEELAPIQLISHNSGDCLPFWWLRQLNFSGRAPSGKGGRSPASGRRARQERGGAGRNPADDCR